MPGQSYIVLRTRSGSHTVNTDSGSLSYVFIVLIMFSQHSKSIFMNLKPIISFVERTLSAINKASQLTRASQDRKWIRARATS